MMNQAPITHSSRWPPLYPSLSTTSVPIHVDFGAHLVSLSPPGIDFLTAYLTVRQVCLLALYQLAR
ncbi:hypothetical protein EG68_06397 [Paragonimus skrjabini miyazakii]|uniref:Uncharacterized protein n=1 Tax=Paragonimus skrjabini miyazakii TaxID=59628 RepID=A0A8S9YUX3_9TREM|nr:hypothetical protein EG68_06397 [Paragonimus skrjabini miyazakii]